MDVEKTVKRLAIYTVYDKDGIIDDYIPYFLDALSPFVTHIVIVCNGVLTDEGRRKLSRFTNDIFVRSNEGFDAGAIKDTLLKLYGWNKVYEYDELLICNDTFYGPLFPLSECFEKMDKLDVDFWGMTEQGKLDWLKEYNDTGESLLPCHLQSYFLNIKSHLLKSDVFCRFWKNLKTSDNICEIIYNYEISFTHIFSQKGYSYAPFVDANELISDSVSKEHYNYSIIDPVTLVKKYRCPLIKRKGLANDIDDDLQYLGNENKNLLMTYIKQNTNYDINLIWDNLLRTSDVNDIKDTLHLHYILPAQSVNFSKKLLTNKKTVVIAHLFYPQLTNECLGYFDNIPPYTDIIVTTSNSEIACNVKKHFIQINRENVQVRLIENHGRDVAALLVACRDILLDYEFLCFTHDKDSYGKNNTKRETESYRYLLWENTLSGTAYIENVLNAFEENQRLGFLSVPQPYHGKFFIITGNEWCGNFENVKLLAEKLHLSCNLSITKPTFSIGTAFWCRTKALKALFEYNWKPHDFPPEPLPVGGTISHAIERIFPYVAQHEGYYSGLMMSDTYAAVRSVDLERITSEVIGRIGYFEDYKSLINNALLYNNDMFAFCEKYPNLYIYGAGVMAERIASLLETKGICYNGFILSDGKPKPDSYMSHPVNFLSEKNFTDDRTGIILGLSRKYQEEVMSLLEERQIKNVFHFYRRSGV